MDDSIISFRNDENEKDAMKLYRRVTRYLRKIIGDSQMSTSSEDVSSDIFFEIYEMQNVSNTEKIKFLIEENINLKNEMQILKSRFQRYLEKTKEILSACEEEQSKKFEKPRTRKGTMHSMKDTFHTTFNNANFHEAKISEVFEIDRMIEEDELQNNLNKIRDLVLEMSKTLRLRRDYYEFNQGGEERNNLKLIEELNSNTPEKQMSSDNQQKQLGYSRENNLAMATPSHLPGPTYISDSPNVSEETLSLAEKVPRLVPEEFVQKCQGCEINFGLCTWKYHCRVCGLVFCFYCSWNFDNFLPFYIYAVRICNLCVAAKKNRCYIKNM